MSRAFNKFLKISIVFLIIFAWFYSAWPQIWKKPPIPPKIQEAQAAAAFQAASAIAASTGADVTVTLPTHATNDIFLLQVVVRDTDDTITVTGWTQITTITDGTAAKHWWFWKRAASASETDPLVDKSTATGDTYASVTSYRGAETSGDPWEAASVAVCTGTTDPFTLTGVTTLTDGSLVVATWNDIDNFFASATYTATNPSSLTSDMVNQSPTGDDGSNVSASAVRTTAGVTGNVSVDPNKAPDGACGLVLALKQASTTTLGLGTDPATATVAPGTAIRDAGAFTFQTDSGTDTVTNLTVILADTGTPYNGISEVRVTSDDGATTYWGAVSNPSGNTLTFCASSCDGNGATDIDVTTTQTPYKIRITPKTHVNMPPVPGAEYDASPYVSAFTSTNSQAGSDSNANTLTIDNLSPNGATGTSGSAGDQQVTLNWTTSNSADFSRSVVLRWAASTPGAEVPAEGTDYAVDATITTATVVCVRTADAASTAVSGTDGAGTGGCSAVALTNDQDYSYIVFQKDSNGNYDAGVTFTGSPFTPNAAQTLTFSFPGGNTVALGTLSTTDVTTGSHTILVGTNAANGVVVTYSGSTLTSPGSDTIDAMATAATSDAGSEQFGINAKDNATPNVGAECSGTSPIAAAATGYATVDNFKFVSGDTIVSSAGSINDTTCTISYIANITAATEAGSYTAILTYIATGNF